MNDPGADISRCMRAALRAARRGGGEASPNPRVGAALETPEGRIRAAHHARFGGPHAEIRLLGSGGGRLPRGSLLCLTLEPCVHQGKTPPCIDRVIAARPSRVSIAAQDPDPRVRGRGVARLRAAGIEVALGEGEDEALAVTLGYHLSRRAGRSLLRLKLASSLDARLAARGGESRWITGAAAREHAHRQRSLADAVVVGSGTLLADDPRLNVRGVRGSQPSRIVVDSTLRIPPRCRMWRAWREETRGTRVDAIAEGNFVRGGTATRFTRRPRLILATVRGQGARRLSAFRDAGWEIWELPGKQTAPEKGARVSLRALARKAARAGLLELLVEAGPGLAGGVLREGLADEIDVYLAAIVLGGEHGWPHAWAAASLKRAPRYRVAEREELGPDLWLRLRREGLLARLRSRTGRSRG